MISSLDFSDPIGDRRHVCFTFIVIGYGYERKLSSSYYKRAMYVSSTRFWEICPVTGGGVGVQHRMIKCFNLYSIEERE